MGTTMAATTTEVMTTVATTMVATTTVVILVATTTAGTLVEMTTAVTLVEMTTQTMEETITPPFLKAVTQLMPSTPFGPIPTTLLKNTQGHCIKPIAPLTTLSAS